MTETIMIVGAIWSTALFCYFWGRSRGIKAERLRTDFIFERSMNTVYSSTVFNVWECQMGRITLDELKDRQREYVRMKEQRRAAEIQK